MTGEEETGSVRRRPLVWLALLVVGSWAVIAAAVLGPVLVPPIGFAVDGLLVVAALLLLLDVWQHGSGRVVRGAP